MADVCVGGLELFLHLRLVESDHDDDHRRVYSLAHARVTRQHRYHTPTPTPTPRPSRLRRRGISSSVGAYDYRDEPALQEDVESFPERGELQDLLVVDDVLVVQPGQEDRDDDLSTDIRQLGDADVGMVRAHQKNLNTNTHPEQTIDDPGLDEEDRDLLQPRDPSPVGPRCTCAASPGIS